MRALARVIWLLTVGLAVVVGPVLLSASPASAHAKLQETTPASGSVVASASAQVTLKFNEAVNIALGRIAVMGPDGRPAQQGTAVATRDGRVSIGLRKGLARGTYLVSYRTLAADGHPLAGGFSFSVGAPSATSAVVPGVGPATPGVDPVVRVLLSGGKYAGYLGVVLLAGALVMALAFWPSRLPLDGPRRWAWWGWGLLVGGTLAAATAQIPYATGSGLTQVTWNQVTAGLSTTVERAQLSRLAIVLAAGPFILRAVTGRMPGRVGRSLGTALGVGLFLTWPLAGHAGSGPWWPVAVAIAAVHVGAMSIWVGGLVVLARNLLPAANPRELAAVLPRWSRCALWAVIAVAISGIAQSALQMPSLAAVTQTPYGQLVLAKIAGLAAILAVAASARRAIRGRYPTGVRGPDSKNTADRPTPGGKPTPSGQPTPGGRPTGTQVLVKVREPKATTDQQRYVHGLRRAVMVEIALACVVIALATALVQTPPGSPTAAVRPTGQNVAAQRAIGEPFYSIDRTPLLTLQVDLTPAQVGSNTMLLTILDPAGQPMKALGWTVKAALPANKLSDVRVPVTSMADNVAYALPQLPSPGDWVFTVTVRTSQTAETVITRTIRVY